MQNRLRYSQERAPTSVPCDSRSRALFWDRFCPWSGRISRCVHTHQAVGGRFHLPVASSGHVCAQLRIEHVDDHRAAQALLKKDHGPGLAFEIRSNSNSNFRKFDFNFLNFQVIVLFSNFMIKLC